MGAVEMSSPHGSFVERRRARRDAVRASMATTDLTALLITDLDNVRYLTGFTGSNAALLVAAGGDDESTFCTDFRYTEQAHDEVPDLAVSTDKACDRALVERVGVGRIGFEEHIVTVAAHRRLDETKAAAAILVGTSGLVENLRAVKDPDEVAALAAACRLADTALAGLVESGGIRAGRTEREVALDLDGRMRSLGSDDVSFPTILAAGENSAIPHHQPSDRALRQGDLVTMDFGAVVAGYHSDMTRMVVLGAPAEWQRELYALVAAAQQGGRAAARAGAELSAIDAAARDVIVDAGDGDRFGHGLGHGVGLQVHEAPWLAPSTAGTIKPDTTITVEPGVYLPGRGGVRIEDSGLVGHDGFTALTLSPRELLAL
jgi:Xaa-Pro aminopeptidase